MRKELKYVKGEIEKYKEEIINVYEVQIKEIVKKNNEELQKKDDSLKAHLNKVSLKQKERLKWKDDEWKKRQEDKDKMWKEKEEEWNRRKKEYEVKLTLVDLAFKDYDMKIKWVKGGMELIDLMPEDEEKEES